MGKGSTNRRGTVLQSSFRVSQYEDNKMLRSKFSKKIVDFWGAQAFFRKLQWGLLFKKRCVSMPCSSLPVSFAHIAANRCWKFQTTYLQCCFSLILASTLGDERSLPKLIKKAIAASQEKTCFVNKTL